MAGTFNGNPLTMAASRATLLEVLTPDVYDGFNRVDKAMKDGLTSVIEKYRLPAYVTGLGAKGSVIYSTKPVREYRDAVGIDERLSYLAWLVPAEPRRVQVAVDQAGDVDAVGVAHRGRREALRGQLRGVRGRRLAVGWTNVSAAA